MKRGRRVWLVVMLAATLLATWWAGSVEEEAVAAAQAAPRVAPSADKQGAGNRGNPGRAAIDPQAALLAQLSRMGAVRELMPQPSRDPFAATSFQPPPPAPTPAAVAIAKPAAPPLPFQYQGLLRQDGKLAVFLADGSELLIAREGEMLAGQYRVERLTEQEIVLHYLPLGERQTLNFGK
ncbi:MAG TPA: hypothetical protein VLI46_06285 [Ramlibacter sp.]|nr:hypothetical protein [Ramlibacter sp.]